MDAVEQEGQCYRAVALGTLANLASGTSTKRAIVQHYNGLMCIFNALQSTNDDMVMHACRALFGLSSNDENKVAIMNAGGLPLLLNCLDRAVDGIRYNAMGAIANLSILPQNKLIIVQHGVLEKMRDLVFATNHYVVRRQVTRCLFALTACAQNRKVIMNDEQFVALILRLLHSGRMNLVLNIVGAIGNIVIEDEYKETFIQSGVIQRLVTLMTARYIPQLQFQVVRALFNFTNKDTAKALLADAGGLQHLIRLTNSDQESIQRDAAGALANMSIGTLYVTTIAEMGGIESMVNLLDSPSADVKRQASRAIFALVKTTANQQRFVQEPNGLKRFVKLLSHSNVEVVKHACGAIANICSQYQKEVIHVGALPKLVELALNHENIDVRSHAVRAISNLNLKNRRKQPLLNMYAGSNGEQRRLRHDMRTLYQKTYDMQEMFLKTFAVNDQEQQQEQQQQQCDVGMQVRSEEPLACDAVEDVCLEEMDCTGVQQKNSVKRKRMFQEMNEEEKDEEKRKKQKKHNCRTARQAFDPDIQISLCVRGSEDRMEFFGHAAILSARWPLLRRLIKENGRRYGEPSSEIVIIRIPREHCHTKEAWYSFFEYLYADSIKVTAHQIKQSDEIATDLADLALSCNMMRLCSICAGINGNLQLGETQSRRASSWVKDMTRLLAVQLFSDVTFCTKERRGDEKHVTSLMNAHKVLLAARCSYFEAQFGNCSWKDSSASIVEFDGNDAAFCLMLKYMYCGTDRELIKCLDADPSLTLQVLVLSNEYGLEGLQAQCESSLLYNINADTVTVLLQELELINVPLLWNACVHFAIKELPRTSWNQLESPHIVSELEHMAEAWGIDI